MRKSKARQSIVETAQELIEKKGYFELNVNEVAYVAKVSVGTLYYHFPKGKVDILAEIMSRRTEGFVEEFQRQSSVDEIIEKGRSLDDVLRWIFKKVIELRRPDRHFLSAIQSEMFANPDEYLEFVKKYQNTDGLQQAMGVLSDVMLKASESRAATLGKLAHKQEVIQRLVGLLMTYQIIFPGYFGDDDEFVNLALGIFFEILKS
ncbi:MAG: TetR/AcrR family transcriptional regulator [Candidatus Thorarchaeota archaeon]|nr:MAG: TetR/AcrR family transcriptional regulator [Candidatus Thorarchaeota archaeon]